jgi:hypothetical protein
LLILFEYFMMISGVLTMAMEAVATVVATAVAMAAAMVVDMAVEEEETF